MLHRHEVYDVIDPASCDTEIAMTIAASLLKTKPRPIYKLSINQDVRAAACKTEKPRTGRCPVEYQWMLGGQVGIETEDRGVAWLWITQALRLGYTVTRYYSLVGHGLEDSESIERARSRAEFARRPRAEIDDMPPLIRTDRLDRFLKS